MSTARILLIAGGVGLLLLLDIVTRRTRYYDPEARPVRAALLGALALAAAWLLAAYFRRSGLHSEQALEALVLGLLWFAGAAGAGLLLRRSAARAQRRRR